MPIDFGPGTIEDDDNIQILDDESDVEEVVVSKKSAKVNQKDQKGHQLNPTMNPDFTFSLDTITPSGTVHPWDFTEARQSLKIRQKLYTSIDDKISKRRRDVSADEKDDNSEMSDDSLEEMDGEVEDTNGIEEDQIQRDTANDDDDEEEYEQDQEDIIREKRKQEYFEIPVEPEQDNMPQTFASMNLSRPVIKALTHLGFVRPTPIQARTIPFALMGKDICGGAVTGSGKTAAFVVPMLERLLYRPKQTPQTRVLILAPTRELAIQCHSVTSKLSQFTDIQTVLCVGGLSTKSQEHDLKKRPDVIVATPGRLIDHIHNSPSFTLDNIEILVMDEADRMLEDGFAAELNEIIRNCPKSRQTMLFSATMTDNVDELIRLSLNHPVRLFVDPNNTAARKLVQEFVRVRAQREEDRPAILLALCRRTFKSRCIIFFRSKAAAHHMKILFGLYSLRAAELHGNLTQEQRLEALEKFRDGEVDFLLATDLASRGLDITGIETVINYNMPAAVAQYLHRVGRTARAGRGGRSITLVGEADRKLLRQIIKNSPNDQVKHRVISHDVIKRYIDKVKSFETDIQVVLTEESEEKEMRQAEMEINKADNMIAHSKEIYARPARTWFQSEREKAVGKVLSAQNMGLVSNDSAKLGKRKEGSNRDKNSGLSRKKKRLLQMRDEDLNVQRSHGGSVKAAKKAARPQRITTMAEPKPRANSKAPARKASLRKEHPSKRPANKGKAVAKVKNKTAMKQKKRK